MLDILLVVLMQTAFVLPPATDGVIDGREALLIWPADQSGTLLDPANCEVHLIPFDEPETHLRYPCGRWFVPPRSQKYDYWLEQDIRISRSQNVLHYSGSASTVGFRIVDRIGPAGFVKIAPPPRSDQTFRVVSLASPGGFELQLSADDIPSRLRVPAGLTLGGVFDGEGNAIALTRAIDVADGKAITLTAAAPAVRAADLLLILDKWGRNRPMHTRIELQRQNDTRTPDAIGETDSRVIAVWYGLPLGAAHARITADGVEPLSLSASLTAGRVATVRSLFPVRTK